MRIVTYFLANVLALSLAGASAAAAQAFFYVPAPEAWTTRAAGPSYAARVVDARPQRASLGLVLRGRKEQAATFHEGVAGTLQPFFSQYAPGQPGAVLLVLRVSGLEIAALPGGVVEGRLSQSATAGLVAAFYAPQPGSSDQPLRGCPLPATGAPTYLAPTPISEAPTYRKCRPAGSELLRRVHDKAGVAALSRLVR